MEQGLEASLAKSPPKQSTKQQRASYTGRHHSSVLLQEGHQVGHMTKDLGDLQTDALCIAWYEGVISENG